ncbi:hypothetical protein [Limnohabitans sp. Rim28]|uniref:hypothetical protein n=1 Tax=Limnohabitans sp. Rim28 TaxID=1100720 RepID=UPI00035C4568|nr:hypothetical protein [Limnohabitans sp. Rim28]PVE08376.1 hypothetical protein B472_05165 [Limnohabitans sp. Rim28]
MSKANTNDKYFEAFDKIFESLVDGQFLWVEDVLNDVRTPHVSGSTKRNKLKEYINTKPSTIEKVRGIYPSASTLVALVEQKINTQVTEANLELSNKVASDIVGSISEPLFKKFLADNLGEHYKGDRVDIPTTKLVEFLMNELSDFYAKSGNALVSIAGTLNEQLLEQAMINQGMTDLEYKRTGKNSEGDFVIYSSVGNRTQIGVEVKSYHARERLLRGLQDITTENKVGFGYFIDPSEFNKHRTVTLLQSNAAAIYMPRSTLEKVEAEAQNMTSNKQVSFQHRFYRPIEVFVSDMKHFCRSGRLPPY